MPTQSCRRSEFILLFAVALVRLFNYSRHRATVRGYMKMKSALAACTTVVCISYKTMQSQRVDTPAELSSNKHTPDRPTQQPALESVYPLYKYLLIYGAAVGNDAFPFDIYCAHCSSCTLSHYVPSPDISGAMENYSTLFDKMMRRRRWNFALLCMLRSTLKIYSTKEIWINLNHLEF